MSNDKIAYVAMCADFIHHGHLNIINEAAKYGTVIVGVLTDDAIASYKRIPALTYEQRKVIVENIKNVSRVIPQNTLDYVPNLELLKPDFVVHGDDWVKGQQENVRKSVVDKVQEWGGKVIDVPYTKGVSSTKLHEHLKEIGTTPDVRRKMLRRILNSKGFARIVETHNGLTGLIAEKISVNVNEQKREFDGMWLSSLTHSASKGKPDIQYVDITSMSSTISEIFEATTKPMIVDADSGGLTEHFRFMVRTLERLGVSAVIIEDKIGAKRNSLFGNERGQKQDTIDNFCFKISEGKKAQITKDFMIIARIESLILKQGLEDALERAHAYVASGSDAIMIHSKETEPDEIIAFCKKFREDDPSTPLVVVPSTYNSITETELKNLGVNVVIYANHLLRSAYPAMVNVCEKILVHERSLEVDDQCLPIKEIITLIPGTDK